MALSFCKKLPALLNKITCYYEGGFYCLNCFYSFRTKNALKKHENVRKNNDYCYVEMSVKIIIF